jgi:hypothetical protein
MVLGTEIDDRATFVVSKGIPFRIALDAVFIDQRGALGDEPPPTLQKIPGKGRRPGGRD